MRERARRLFAQGARRARAACASRPSTASPRPCWPRFPAEAGIAPGLPADRGARGAGAGADDACQSARRCRGERTTRPARRRPAPQPAAAARTAPSTYLMRCARAPEAMAAFGLPDDDRAACSDGSMDLPEESTRRLSRRTIAATTASTATCCARSPTPTAAGAPRPARTSSKRSSAGWRWTAPAGRSALAGAGAGRLHRQRRPAQGYGRPAQADPDYDRHAERAGRGGRRAARASRTAPALAADMAAGLRAGQAFAAAYDSRQAQRRGRRFRRPDRLDPQACSPQPGMGEWVRFKLDRRTDHILVDEAQDTNRAQWDIVQALAARIFQRLERGRGAPPHPLHGRRLQAGDLPLPGDRSARIRACCRLGARRIATRCARPHDESESPWSPPEFRDLSIECQLPLGAGDPRGGRCRHRRGRSRGDGPSRAARIRTALTSTDRPGEVDAVAAIRASRMTARRRRRGGLARRGATVSMPASWPRGPALARREAGAGDDRAAADAPATS